MRPRLFRPGHPAGALVLVAAMASMVCSGDQARDPAQADTLLTGVTEVIPEVATLPGVPGFAVSAVRGTDLVLEHAYGLADVDTGERLTPRSLFYIASTSKSFTATAAAVLQQRGELDFRQTLADALPEVRLQPPLSPASITIRDLLTMSHGIGRGGTGRFQDGVQRRVHECGAGAAARPASAVGRREGLRIRQPGLQHPRPRARCPVQGRLEGGPAPRGVRAARDARHDRAPVDGRSATSGDASPAHAVGYDAGGAQEAGREHARGGRALHNRRRPRAVPGGASQRRAVGRPAGTPA